MRARIALVCVGMSVLLALALVLAPVDLCEATSYVTGHPRELALALLAYTGAFVLRAVLISDDPYRCLGAAYLSVEERLTNVD